MERRIIIHSRPGGEEYFFSTDHCQGVRKGSEETYPEGFVPITHYLPHSVVPRPELPSGLVETVEDLLKIFYHDGKEIPNPDPKYQPERNEGE